MRTLVCVLIRGYQVVVSPLVHLIGGAGCGCRFTPTCSEYCMGAVQIHGTSKGLWLGVCRICRCNPWGKSGLDPVPSRFTQS